MRVRIHKYLGYGCFDPPIEIDNYFHSLIITLGPISVSHLIFLTGIPRSTIWYHIKKLIKAKRIPPNLIDTKRRGRPTYRSIKDKLDAQLKVPINSQLLEKFRQITEPPQEWIRSQIRKKVINNKKQKNNIP